MKMLTLALGLIVFVSVLLCDYAAAAAATTTWDVSGFDADAAGLSCDFEDTPCRWQWSRFIRRSAAEINATLYTVADPTMISGPMDDADGRPTGT